MNNLFIHPKSLTNTLIRLCIFLLFASHIMISPVSAQTRSKAELIKAARIAFSGKDLSKKAGKLSKAGFDLALLAEEYKDRAAVQTLAPFISNNSLIKVENNRVIVDVVSNRNTDSLELELKNLGMIVTGVAGSTISGSLPISSIEAVAGLDKVQFFHPSLCKTNVGLTTSQGDAAMRSNAVRTSLGCDGTGITVGVISDSYNSLGTAPTDVASGDLPAGVNVIADDGTTDEGRAMLQIVHDVAPGASLAFATAKGGQAAFASHIDELVAAGADVIVDDMIYFAEPMFQDGIIAQAADRAYAAGVPYFSSAGNQANQSYESTWRDGSNLGEDIGVAFDFDPGAGVDDMQSFTLGAGKSVLITLQWDSPFFSVSPPGSQNDLDLYLLDAAGTTVLASSTNNNINSDAYEILQYTNTTGSAATFNLLITWYSGPKPGFIKYVNFGTAQGSLEYATNSSTIYGHSNAAGAEAVAAAFYYYTPVFGTNPPLLESFSSVGPTAIRFNTSGAPIVDARADKPEITAPDGVNTTFFGSFDSESDGFNNFFGTSAAAPHAAAVAALMLSRNNSLTPAQIYASLEASAIDMGTPGFDNMSGFGLIQADQANPLPVELISFEASINSSAVGLKWQTATEQNNYGFEIERSLITSHQSLVNSGNTNWASLGFVHGAGNSNSPKDYSFIDTNPIQGNAQYRLKQIDLDGNYKYYSQTAKVNFGMTDVKEKLLPKEFGLSQNYPNPFNPVTVISYQLPVSGNVLLKVYDILGNEVATLVNETKAPGYYQAVFNANNLSTGVYIYRITAGSFTSTKKLMLMK